MSQSLSDRNLLLGILALQFGLVTREQLIAGISAWGADSSQQLDEIFHRLKFITDDGLQKLRTLLDMHLQMHGGNVEKSLAILSSVADVRNDLQQLKLPELEQSLRHLSPSALLVSEPPLADPFETATTTAEPRPGQNLRTFSAGQSSSDGLRFRILRPHAKGGLGEVSVALDSELNREVALKEIQLQHAWQAESRSRFLLEAQITGGLEHPGIVPVYGVGTYADGRPFYAMRFIRGDSLKEGIKNFFAQFVSTPLSASGTSALQVPARAYESFEFRKLLQRFIDVCNAIAYAHARGVLHRDLKPGNIMLGNYGETLVVDWGLAKATGQSSASVETSQGLLVPSTDSDSAETMMGSAFGTPAYMSPEQAGGRVDLFGPGTDIYCLGATLYHLLTGQPPHINNADGRLRQRIQAGDFAKPRDLNPAIPAPLASICLKALATDHAQRYASALSLAADVEHWLADDPVSAYRDSLLIRLQRWSRRHRTLVTGAAALLLTATFALLISYVLLQAEQSRTLIAKRTADDALTEARNNLGANYFQQGIAEYEQGRVASALHDLNRAISLTSDERLMPSLRRVFVDRALHGGKLIAPPLLHGGTVVEANFSPDGTRVATASEDETARLWDAHTGAPLGSAMQHDDLVHGARFSPDGTRVVTFSDDHTARLWNGQTGAPLGAPLRHERAVGSASFNPDGTRVITASDDHTARLWDAQTGAPLGAVMQHDHEVNCASFSPDGKLVVTGSTDNSARLWDAETGEPNGISLLHENSVESAVFSPDGSRIVTGDFDHQARLWDVRTGAPLGEIMEHESIVHFAIFSPDGSRVVTTSFDDTARLWDALTGQPLSEPLQHGDLVHTACFSPDGTQLVTASWDYTCRLWDVKTGVPLGTVMRHDLDVNSACFSPDGSTILTASTDHTARLWNVQTGAPLGAAMRHDDFVRTAAFSADGTRVVTGSSDHTARLWDGRLGTPLGKVMRHEHVVDAVNFSPDGSRIVTGSADKTAQLWNAQTGAPLGIVMRLDGWFESAEFSPDGTRILTQGGREAHLWNALTGTQQGAAMLHVPPDISSARFSPDGTRVVTASHKMARLWNAKTGAPLGAEIRHAGLIKSASFSPDGSRVVTASSDETARLWDGQTGAPVGEVMRHEDSVLAANFDRSDTWIVTASSDDTARLWDAKTGAPWGAIMRHAEDVDHASFSPDGTRVLTGNRAQGNARLWDTQTSTPLGETRRHDGLLSSVSFSPDGTRILTASWDHTARLWDGGQATSTLVADAGALEALRSLASGEIESDRKFRKLTLAERQVAREALMAHPAWQTYRRQLTPQLLPRHESQAAAAERRDDWFAAAWHWERLAMEKPGDSRLKVRWETAKQKSAEKKAEWERMGKESNKAKLE